MAADRQPRVPRTCLLKVRTHFSTHFLSRFQFELGHHYVNGEYAEGTDDDKLMNGILTQAAKDPDYILVDGSEANHDGRKAQGRA